MSSINEIPVYVTTTTPSSFANSSIYGGRGPPLKNDTGEEADDNLTTFFNVLDFVKASIMVNIAHISKCPQLGDRYVEYIFIINLF